MGKRKYARDPMLYIQQPGNKNPRATMQHSYRTKKVTSSSVGVGYSRRRSFLDEEREARQYEESVAFEEETEEASAEEDKEIVQQEETKRKKFNERTLEEKISYFADTPHYAPKKKCEIKTDNKTYRGTIIKKDDEDVYIKIGNRSRVVKITINEIKNIRLLGLS